MYECGLCYKQYKTEKRLFSHVSRRHSMSRSRTYVSRSRQDRRFENQAMKYYTEIKQLENENRQLKSHYVKQNSERRDNDFEIQNQLYLRQKSLEREKSNTFNNQLVNLQNTVNQLAQKLSNQTESEKELRKRYRNMEEQKEGELQQLRTIVTEKHHGLETEKQKLERQKQKELDNLTNSYEQSFQSIKRDFQNKLDENKKLNTQKIEKLEQEYKNQLNYEKNTRDQTLQSIQLAADKTINTNEAKYTTEINKKEEKTKVILARKDKEINQLRYEIRKSQGDAVNIQASYLKLQQDTDKIKKEFLDKLNQQESGNTLRLKQAQSRIYTLDKQLSGIKVESQSIIVKRDRTIQDLQAKQVAFDENKRNLALFQVQIKRMTEDFNKKYKVILDENMRLKDPNNSLEKVEQLQDEIRRMTEDFNTKYKAVLEEKRVLGNKFSQINHSEVQKNYIVKNLRTKLDEAENLHKKDEIDHTKKDKQILTLNQKLSAALQQLKDHLDRKEQLKLKDAQVQNLNGLLKKATTESVSKLNQLTKQNSKLTKQNRKLLEEKSNIIKKLKSQDNDNEVQRLNDLLEKVKIESVNEINKLNKQNKKLLRENNDMETKLEIRNKENRELWKEKGNNNDEITHLNSLVRKTARESVTKLNGLSQHSKKIQEESNKQIKKFNEQTELIKKITEQNIQKDQEINNKDIIINEARDKLNKLTKLLKNLREQKNNIETKIKQDKPNTNKELEIELKKTQLTLSQNLLTLDNLQKYMRNKIGNQEFNTIVKKARSGKLGLKVK
jgi:hypothetical protein